MFGIKINVRFFLIFLTALIITSFAGCGKDSTVPQHLIGVWKTSAPKYEDRYLKISKDMLIFGVGNGEEISHFVGKIKVKKENKKILYTFHYKDSEGEKWTLTIEVLSDIGGIIKLKNRDEIWKKVETSGG